MSEWSRHIHRHVCHIATVLTAALCVGFVSPLLADPSYEPKTGLTVESDRSNPSGSPATPGPDPHIVVLSPLKNAVVRPGERIWVRVEVDPNLQLYAVGILSPSKADILPLTMKTPPYVGEIVIPKHLIGPVDLSVIAKTKEGEIIVGPVIPIGVVPDEIPTVIEASGGLRFELPGGSGNVIRGSRDPSQIWVRAYYANNSMRDLYLGMLGITYASLNPQIATVSPDGVVTPIGAGVTFIRAEYKGLKAYAKVEVEDPKGGARAPVDQTAHASIRTRDIAGNPSATEYTQQLTIINTSSVPVAANCLVFAGLPERVMLGEQTGRTQSITPFNSPFIRIPLVLAPGESVTGMLHFSNPDRVPITYTPKLMISGAQP